MEDIQDKYLFVTITRNSLAKINDFVKLWSNGYNYPNMKFYNGIISKNEFEISDLKMLFEWKNGMPLSQKKLFSFEQKILNKLPIINKFKLRWDEVEFNTEFEKVSTVWKIFLLHIIQPEDFPIFDQHVYRAYKYIVSHIENAKLPYSDIAKFKIYYKEYLPFYMNCQEEMDKAFTSKNLDDALWTFGKFLNEYPKLVL